MSLRMVRQEIQRIRENEKRRTEKFDTLYEKQEKRNHLEIKSGVTERKIRLAFKNTIDAPLEYIETIIDENERIQIENESSTVVEDDEKYRIFMRNVLHDRYNYISYAVSMGFQGINHIYNEYGTALHHAIRNGFIHTIEELIRNGADGNIKNSYGNFPCHEVWTFWKRNYPYNYKEKPKQIQICFTMLQTLAMYNNFIDHQDIYGNTCLMYASKYGLIKIVISLLGFQSDIHILNKIGKSALDIAQEANQIDIVRILNCWGNIRKELIKADFNVLWTRFLKDSQANINSAKDVTTSLVELEFQFATARMNQPEDFYIDDELLRDAHVKDKIESRKKAVELRKMNKHKQKFMPATIQKKIGRNNKQKEIRPQSQMLQRRLKAANTIALDGTFLKFTKRPATSSAIRMSTRSPSAPLEGTEEEFSELRKIGSQGLDFDNVVRKPVLDDMKSVLFRPKPRKDSIGAYSVGVDFMDPTEKQVLMSRLANKGRDSAWTADDASSSILTLQKKPPLPHLNNKIDLIDEKRCRFVTPDLLPANELVRRVDPFLLHKYHDPLYPADIIIYGKNRLLSTHFSKSGIEEPWSSSQQKTSKR